MQKSRIKSFIQAMMLPVQMVSQVILADSVMDMARELFYTGVPQHSPELYLCRLGSFLAGVVLVKAVQWRKTTGSSPWQPLNRRRDLRAHRWGV